MKPRVVIILGPTGVGKSEVAIDVALRVEGEVINADSQLVYRHMDIGTAKPPASVRQKVAHHLIDIVDPDGEFNAALYRELALKVIQDVIARRKKAIVCGGTGLYMRALTQGLFVGPAKNPEVRKRLEEEARERGSEFLYERLRQVDPDATDRIHPNDRYRIVRALEIFELTGKGISRWQKEHGFRESAFEVLKIGLNREREELYALINRRCDEMIGRGLVDEVNGLVERGYGLDLPALQSVGYRQIGLYLRGRVALDEAVALIKRDTRHLAKRQLTWFRGDKEIRWFHPERDRKQILDSVKEYFASLRRVAG
ncbi:MAG: tRNA (adenosine(37)-N6)-dimethylallyltransferase MiaA [Deltaproteobacteria bacterium]|nr:tRNA (adenosine(37)-N6)-dimethylallyltransferase MiaA [Deltaproteobacteria bacterium]